MAKRAVPPPGHQATRVSDARERFLSSGRLPPGLRPQIGDSWARSAQRGVDPENLRTQPTDEELPDGDILRRIDAVLERNAEAMADEPISLIFAAPSGRVVQRYCSDQGLARQLESVFLAPGFGYGEADVGTNGIGTALAAGQPTLVVGGEHFNQRLSLFACAGAPLYHPISGALLGVIDITCAAGQVNPLLIGVARGISAQIRDALTEMLAGHEMALMCDYLAACRHSTGPILALNGEVVMMNRHAQALLDPSDRAALLAYTADSAEDRHPGTLVTDLPSGTTARMHYRPTFFGDDLVGGVFRVQVGDSDAEVHRPSPRRGRNLPGLVGSSPEWIAAGEQLMAHCTLGRSIIVEGESSVGKLAMVKAAHYADGRAGHLRILDCADSTDRSDQDGWLTQVQQEFEEGSGTLVLRHLDKLPAAVLRPLAELLLERRGAAHFDRAHWLVATRSSSPDSSDLDGVIVPCFDGTIRVPPLRRRPEDIGALASHLLRRVARSEDLSFTPVAMRQLGRLPWPGNLAQLMGVAHKIVLKKRTGVIDIRDLPPECHATTRRMLSQLECLECDAIVEALQYHHGNKIAAAEQIGMSRATMYRRIREYGIVGMTDAGADSS